MVVRLPLASIFQYDQSGRRRGEVAMSMAAPGNVFHQPHIPGTKNMLRAIAKSYFHLTPKMND